MNGPRHVLVASDFSDASHVALEAGRDLARTSGGKLTLLHVSSPGAEALGAAGVEEGMAIGHRVHEAIAELKDRLTGVADSKVEILHGPSPAATIVDYATVHGVDLIVVGSHGRDAAGRFLLGSIADRVVHHAPCSVLVARKAPA